jgi:hypothetical protein
MAVTAGLVALAWHLLDDGDADADTYIAIVMFTLFAAGFGFLSCLVLLRVRRLEFDQFSRSLCVYSGYFPFVRRAEISTKDIDVTLSANSGSTQTTLTLRRRDSPESPIELARAEFKSELEAVYNVLRQWFSGSGRDGTLVAVTAPNGKLIEFSTTPINPIGSSFETACLTADSRGRLASRATLKIRAFWLAFAAMGAMILVFLFPDAVKDGSLFPVALAGGLGALFLVAGTLGLTNRLQLWRFSADCNAQIVTLKPGILSWNQVPQTIRFDQVAAVQLCSKIVEKSEGDGYTTIELNLVLCDPPGARIPLMSHGDETSIMQSARTLAAALERPLLDHRLDAIDV